MLNEMKAYAMSMGYKIDLELQGANVRAKIQDDYTRSQVKYNQVVIMHRFSEDGRRHSAIRIEEYPGPHYYWHMQTDWSRYDENPIYLKFEGTEPAEFMNCLPQIVAFIVPLIKETHICNTGAGLYNVTGFVRACDPDSFMPVYVRKHDGERFTVEEIGELQKQRWTNDQISHHLMTARLKTNE